jgi:hypothetical protein
MIHFFRKKRRYISILLLSIFVLEMVPLRTALALTSGPSQPEVQSFQPAGTSDMVDLFSGDFSYNIPLFELPGPNGGYPFNLSYQSGINTDQEASWVGLGWNLQPGAINRQVRGLPDEFNGEDKIQTKMSIAPNVTVGVGTGVGVELFGGDLSLGLGFSVYQNNYRGAGYSIDGSIGFGKSSSSGATAGIGLGFSLDSKEGVSLSPTLSLGNKDVNVGLGIGYNSKEGLTSLSFDANMHSRWSSKIKPGEESKKSKQRSFAFGAGTSLSFTHPSYTPQITYPMNSSNIAATLKIGGAFWGIYGSAYLTGFYNEQTMVGNKRWVSAPAYGYLNYQKAEGIDNSLMDVNREKDGIVSAISPNLPIPSLTYDIYSVTGQGISAMYRPFRNDFGTTKDQKISSESSGGSGGIDFGPALTHLGLNLSLNYSRSESGFWNNDMSAKAKFGSGDLGSLYEPVYFKAHGEPSAEAATTLDALGGDRAVRVKLRDSGNSAEATSQLQYSNRNTWAEELPAADKSQGRKTRNQTIQTYTNSQILNGAQEVLPHFRIQYFNENNNEVDFDRSTLRPHHTTAFTALTPEGLRYNYGIPAYNFRHEELTFSVKKKNSDTDQVEIDLPNPPGNLPDYDKEPRHDPATSVEKYLRRVKTPEYAHSFLLTSILGPDYVDVTGDGVTADDLGYWVKFTYQRTATKESPFKWRDPFIKAHLQEGWKSDPRDDKGSFVYGEKEIWYMRRAETKSHIADFIVSSRDDGRGIETKLQNAPVSGSGKRLSKLDRIVLYTRFANATHPIKEVHFEYNYSLCANTLNSYPSGSNPNKGKLTLNKLFFKYGTSGRGEFNPYQFSYASNYSYQMLSYDRWGNYKPNNTTGVMNNDFPYVNQDPARKADIDNYAAAWSLAEIQLPSGGLVKVDYETDDYAYVQHKQAMQMTEVVNPNGTSSSAETNTTFELKDDNLKVRFKLEQQIDKTTVADDPAWQKSEVLKYVDASTYQLYFKFLISLRKPSEGFGEYISGYVDIDKAGPMKLELDASGKYGYGSFYVLKEDGNGNKNRNPFAMRAWQHLRTNQPELTNSGAPVKATDNNNEKIKQMMGVGSIFDQVSRMFKGFYTFCSDFGWGREVTIGKAWVRLKSPDKIKYGGGLRVKQITMKDNWQGDEEGVYGQVYDYTTLEVENGPTISSGVAAYEPFVGGEENPLRYAKKYTESVPLRADNNLFFEYPINESYYPGPQVGYSKVTVSSLASASLAGKPVTNSIFPTGAGVSFGTSGKTVHEFYTAKDFPVITDETEKENQPYRLSVTIPFIGSLSISKLTASQGYSIITNDMHGKQKKVSNYRQDPAGKFEPEPISWVKYNYKSEPRFYQQERVFSLSNKFIENGDGTLSFPEPNNTSPLFTLGQENEFFMDMRKFEDNAYTGGVRINLDILYFFFITIPAYVPWPSVGLSENQLRTAVTNKVVFKSGMMESIEAFDGGSLIKTENRKWDKQTGAVVLTLVNNNFDAPVFSYNILAHQKYQGMGAAYQNSGFTFTAVNVKAVPNQANQYEFAVKEFVQAGSLYPGDELLLYNSTGNIATPLARAVYTGEENGINKWHSEQALAATSYKALIVRSGYRNQLSVSAGNITALEDPSKKGVTKTFSKTLQIPK